MKKTLYDIQDIMDGTYSMLHEIEAIYDIQDMEEYYEQLDELSEAVNELLTENENLKNTLRTKEIKALADKRLKELAKEVTEEEQFYLDYFKEYYGKELE